MIGSYENERDFVYVFNELANVTHRTAREKGFYEEPPSDIERIALMMEELGDAIKAIRAIEMPPDPHCPSYSRLEIKLADTIIRIMDYAKYRELKVADALISKMHVNHSRPHKHGKKL